MYAKVDPVSSRFDYVSGGSNGQKKRSLVEDFNTLEQLNEKIIALTKRVEELERKVSAASPPMDQYIPEDMFNRMSGMILKNN